jgi:hypothetical protein
MAVQQKLPSISGDKPSEAQTLRAVERLLTDALPRGWSFRGRREVKGNGRVADAEWTVSAPDGTAATFVVEAKRSIDGRQLDAVLWQLEAFRERGRPVVAAPYLGPTVRAALIERGVSFVDSTGNLWIVADRPGVLIERHGAEKDPWPSEQSLQSLRGRAAGRAVRAVVDFRPPYGVRELATRAGVPLASLSRTLDLLDRDGLVTRGTRGDVLELDWAGTIRRWSGDYEFTRSNAVSTYLEPRGLGALTDALSKAKWTYAATGSLGAQRFSPISPARQAALYVEDVGLTAEQLRLRPAETGANIVLAEPFDSVVFERSTTRDGLRVVAASQLAADLLTGPGREPSEGNELLTWMRKNEDAWRV